MPNTKPRGKIIIDQKLLDITIIRLAHQLIETHDDFSNTALIGLQPRGIYLAKRVHQKLTQILKKKDILLGELDTTFYRDDFRRKELIPNKTNIDFIIEDKNVVLIDDVLFTGRTIRAGLDALLAFGRPKDVELLVLIDRRFSRHLPIQAKYVGKVIDSIASQNVKVDWSETDEKDKVTIIN
ncbi:MAG: bifunctional pyr operon transcriptional regulator/uracil phosphoribosyltransferase PyrR [Bacteroidota bacterium]|jgi:pyrimidine operon attenuation protein/uracil phosphoribosyltransferase